jgi:hypothetical protein
MPTHAVVDTIAIAVPEIRLGAASRAQISKQVITPANPKPNRIESENSAAMLLVCVNQKTTGVCANARPRSGKAADAVGQPSEEQTPENGGNHRRQQEPGGRLRTAAGRDPEWHHRDHDVLAKA